MALRASQRYRVLHPLEPGPGVRVFLVEDLWQEAARKVLTLIPGPFRVGDPDTEAVEELYNRRRSVRHPLLVEVLDVGIRGRQVGLITEFSRMAVPVYPSGLPLERRIELALELTLVLDFLHRRQMLVGWLSPRKIFCNGHRLFKVNAVVPASEANTPSLLSIRYCAPEILQGTFPTPESDRYSLGMLLYYILTGAEPFGDSDASTLKTKQAVALPIPPRQVNPQLSHRVEEIILKLIAKSSRDRITLPMVADTLANLAGDVLYRTPSISADLINRKRELAQLRETILTLPRTRRSSIIAVNGDAGVGKSFLTEQVLITAKLHNYFTIDLIHARSDAAFGAFARTLPFLLPKYTTNTKPADRLVNFLETRGQDQCVLIRAQNLQWIDEGCLDVYRKIVLQNKFPCLIIGDCQYDDAGKYWEEIRNELLYRERLTEFRITALTNDETITLLERLLSARSPQAVANTLIKVSSGNPYYLIELLHGLIERRDLLFTANGWFWRHQICADSLLKETVTVVRSIQSRLSTLPRVERKVLTYLAMADRELSLEMLSQLINIPEKELEHTVTTLERRSFVTISGSLRSPSVFIAHSWVGYVMKELVTTEETKAIHQRIVNVLESLPEGDKVSSEELAHHVISGGLSGKRLRHISDALSFLRRHQLYRQAYRLQQRSIEHEVMDLSRWSNFRDYVELLYLSGELDVCVGNVRRRRETETSSKRQVFLLQVESRILASRGEHVRAAELLEIAKNKIVKNDPVENEILGELLGCLSCMGNRGRARSVAREILVKLRFGQNRESVEKLYHSLYLFYAFAESNLGLLPLKWEVKSLRLCLTSENYLRVFGRLFNLGGYYIRLGNFGTAKVLTTFSHLLSGEIENSEMGIYCQINMLLIGRKAGQHKDTLVSLEELSDLNERVNRNPHLEVELHIEIAKNACYQLVLPLALEHLNAIKELPACGQVSSSNADALLLEGWTRILLGRPEEAIELAEKVRRQEIPREAGRSYLLSGQAFMALGNLESAAAHAQSALDRFPVSVPYYRTRARILQAEVALRTATSKRAGAYAEGALRLARDHFYQPLLAKAFCLKAECLRRRGELTRARAHALRAQQVASRVERPALLAEILLQLARVEEEQGARLQAEERRAEARELIASRRDLLPETQREGFARAFAEFLREPDAAGPPQLPRTLVGICELATRFREGRRVEDLATSLLDCLQRQLKVTGVQLYTPGRDGTPRVVASARKCHLDGRELIQSDGPPGARVRVLGRTTTLVVPLEGRNRVEGWIYLERVGGTLPEVDYDFLACVKAIAEIPLFSRDEAGGPPLREAPAGSSHGMVGEHPSMIGLRAEIARFAQSDSTVLISGESGTGKELVAREIHGISKRSEGPFLAVNCAGFAADLVESQLFGHARGSFTGAVENRVGFFEAAAGGTLFLDEISSMHLSLQPKLLRVLQEKKVIRLGETAERSVDTRIVAATNQDLKQLAARGEFRPDLYHRLNVLQIHVPPLRLRASDIPALCRHFLAQIRQENGVDAVMSNSALEALRRYDFPGNIRELRNLLENLAHTAAHGIITLPDVERRLQGDGRADDRESDRQILGILDEIVSGRADFWGKVRDPFMKRELSRRDVMRIVSKGLEACGGSYRQLTEYLGMKPKDYKRLLNFLANHQCKVDFRTYRTGRAEE